VVVPQRPRFFGCNVDGLKPSTLLSQTDATARIRSAFLPTSVFAAEECEEFRSFVIADAEQEIECTCMTTQQKITAIQAIITNHHDNVAAMSAANVGQGLEALVIEAMNTAFKDDLAVIFAANSSRPAQNVRRKRQA